MERRHARIQVRPGTPSPQNPRSTSGPRNTRDKLAPRRLLIVPVLHSEVEMGSMAPTIRRVSLERFGRRRHQRNVNAIARGWAAIRTAVVAWKLPWNRVRLYQDGLPGCGREADIVRTLAMAGSVNHQLLLELMDKGATLTGTESAELVMKEYQQLRQRLAAIPQDAPAIQTRHAARAGLLLGRRDRYIAKRINATLRAGEIGILFIGLLHAVEPHLAGDVLVEHPIQRLPTGCTP